MAHHIIRVTSHFFMSYVLPEKFIIAVIKTACHICPLFQIYNEMIRDLLNPGAGVLDLREDYRGEVQVAGLSQFSTNSSNEVCLARFSSVTFYDISQVTEYLKE